MDSYKKLVEASSNGKTILLPKKMFAQEYYEEKLGFVFDKDNVLGQNTEVVQAAILPEGWKIKDLDGSYGTKHYEIFDNRGRRRATYYITQAASPLSAFLDASQPRESNARMWLCPRFKIEEQNFDEGTGKKVYRICVVDYAKGNIIFDVGIAKEIGEKYNNLNELANQFLKANFPEWEDPRAYWD